MSLNQKAGRLFFKITGMLMLMAALVVWGGQAMAEEALPAEDASDVKADAKSAPCKGLKPYNNIDELLYQFYVNLDSDCLFTMPVAELEKTWGIKILSRERLKPGQYLGELRESDDFKAKPYVNEKDAFFIEIDSHHDRRSFIVSITNFYSNEHGTLFPDGNYPKLIPEPTIKPDRKIVHPPKNNSNLKRKITRGKYRLLDARYYWVNSEHTRQISLMGTNGVTGVMIY